MASRRPPSRVGMATASKKNESQRPGTNVRGGGFGGRKLRFHRKTVRRAIPFQNRALCLAWGRRPTGTLRAGNTKGPPALIQPAFGNHSGISHNLALFEIDDVARSQLVAWLRQI